MTDVPLNAPPEDLLKKLAQIQKDFPDGFVIFIPPQKKDSAWVGVFRYNPTRSFLIEAIYDKIVTGKMMGGSSN